jgi:hypothetical protein
MPNTTPQKNYIPLCILNSLPIPVLEELVYLLREGHQITYIQTKTSNGCYTIRTTITNSHIYV